MYPTSALKDGWQVGGWLEIGGLSCDGPRREDGHSRSSAGERESWGALDGDLQGGIIRVRWSLDMSRGAESEPLPGDYWGTDLVEMPVSIWVVLRVWGCGTSR